MSKVFHSKQPVSFKEKVMPSGDVYIINPPSDPSWISVTSQWASTWLWEHSDLIPLLLSECLLAAVIVATFYWRERRQAHRADAETMKRIGTREFNNRRDED
jgi:hypothetical protein